MRDPVIAEDGHSYEKSALENWFATQRQPRSPKTNQILQTNMMIPNHALRSTIEEFFTKHPNALRNSSAMASQFEDLPVDLKATTYLRDGKRYLHASVNSSVPETRQPAVFIAIVDNSGSMGENAEPKDAAEAYGYTRQDLVGHGLMTVASILGPDDMLAIIKFSTSAQVVMRPTRMDDAGRLKVKAAVETIKPDSQTNIFDGIRLAMDMANQPDMQGRNIVGILLTDGFPNISPPRGIIPTLSSLPLKNPWTMSTFGFGYNLDSALLSELAEWGGGLFGFIPDCTMVGTVLINYVASMLSMASRSKPILTPNATVATGPIQHGQTRDFVQMIPSDGDVAVEGFGTTLSPVAFSETPDEFAIARHAYIEAISKAMALSKDNSQTDEPRKVLMTFYDAFATSDNPKVKALLRDVKSDVESEGQVSMAISPKFFDRWGGHYLRSYLHAQKMQMCMNFKDPGLQIYGGELFHTIQTAGDLAFTTLPPPIPSGAQQQRATTPPYAAATPGYRRGSYTAIATPLSMASWHNQSGGCFNGECRIKMADGTLKAIKDVVAGEQVATPMGPQTLTAVVVCGSQLSSQPMVQLENLSITPWHPILIAGQWVFPADIAPYTSRPIRTVYNFVLPAVHIVYVEGYQCCTLGHGLKGPVIEHDFFGTEKVIECLKAAEGWSTGRPTFKNLMTVRDPATKTITGWVDKPI
jgi:hypothetical protein